MKRRSVLAALAGVVLATTPAVADYPFCACRRQADAVFCRAGFSDGESAEGALLEVIADDGSRLQRLTFGPDSTLTFTPPSSGYYVLFDAGPGLTVEVEPRDIR
ncbi:hypothetical protein ACFQI3_00805 [Hansschlegelia quercus]|uniref:Uncharacterized protein n=1 Tax=Hansschlegelia quercus TaxID=2528245 RepID=A0A4V2JDV5_9HYPH|nr:hypothetical protein [Hansschlegelia quercus]TBN51744.1 hypothetical protein EYR15_12575 [Hansschlegelia quercus]